MSIRNKLIKLALEGASYAELRKVYDSGLLAREGEGTIPMLPQNVGAITILDENYPGSLLRLHKPPIVLFYKGNIELLRRCRKKVAIVGTRRASSYGVSVAEKISTLLASRGVCVVSGLARGIDVASHRNIVEKGVAIAVLGNGVNVYYPYSNREVQKKIAEKGLLLSEYPPDARGSKWSFVARNRIIAALSDLVIVVESPLRGGSIHTAEFALELGIPVAAVPGDIFRVSSQGTNRLIADGALVITSPGDVFSILGISEEEKEINSYVVDVLKKEGGRISISSLKGYYESTGAMMKELSRLEMKNIIRIEGSVVILLEQ